MISGVIAITDVILPRAVSNRITAPSKSACAKKLQNNMGVTEPRSSALPRSMIRVEGKSCANLFLGHYWRLGPPSPQTHNNGVPSGHFRGSIVGAIKSANRSAPGRRQRFKAILIIVRRARIRGWIIGAIRFARASTAVSNTTTHRRAARLEHIHGWIIGAIRSVASSNFNSYSGGVVVQ